MENLVETSCDNIDIHVQTYWDDRKSTESKEVGAYEAGTLSDLETMVDKVVTSLKKDGFEILTEFKPDLEEVNYIQYTAKAKSKDGVDGLLDITIFLDDQDSFGTLVKEKLPKIESIEDVKARIKALHEQFEMFQQPIMGEADDEEEADPEMIDYENKLTDDVLEKFAEGLLTKLGELEMLGQVPPIENPNQAKKALLAVIRSLNLRKGIINKMGRKFARLGAKQFLRRQRRELSHSLTK